MRYNATIKWLDNGDIQDELENENKRIIVTELEIHLNNALD